MRYFLIVLFGFLSLSVWAKEGVVEGVVLDKSSNEPLSFATVLVQGTTIATSTDQDGKFLLSSVPVGFRQLQVSFVGYETGFSEEFNVTQANKVYLKIYLNTSEEELEGVTIQASIFRKEESAPLSLHRIGVSEIESNPGSNRDISKVIQSFPGVSSSISFRNDVVIRGGGPGENKFFLDGIEIPTINHFATQGASGGPVGILNADFITGVDFYSSAFPSMRANAASGVFAFTQKSGNPDRLKTRVGVGASEAFATLDGPLGKKTTFIASVRQSYLQFLFDAFGLPFLPTFNDYQLKLKSNINKKNELTIVSIGALDQFAINTGIENPDEQQQFILAQIPVNEQWNYAIGAVWKRFISSGFQTFVLSRNMLNNESFKYPDNDETRPKIQDYLSQEIENKFRFEQEGTYKGWKYAFGLQLEQAKYNTNSLFSLYAVDRLIPIVYDSEIDFFKYGGGAQLSNKVLDNRLMVSVGLRLDANSFEDKMANPLNQISPRLAFSYDIKTQWRLNANIARYHQLPAYTTLGYKDQNNAFVNRENGVSYIGVNHFVMGTEFNLNSRVNFMWEVFYKRYDKYPISVIDSISLANKGGDFGVVGNEEVVSNGDGRAYGMELSSRGRLKTLNYIFSYTMVISEFTDLSGRYIPSAWDNRHILTATLVKNFKKNWSIGGKWRFVGGVPFTPYDLTTSSVVEAWNTEGGPLLDYNRFNGLRSGVFHQLDLRVDKKFFFEKWSLMLYFDVQNAYNFKFKGQDIVVREIDNNGDPITINGGQNYLLRSIESLDGNILPTIGIIAEF